MNWASGFARSLLAAGCKRHFRSKTVDTEAVNKMSLPCAWRNARQPEHVFQFGCDLDVPTNTLIHSPKNCLSESCTGRLRNRGSNPGRCDLSETSKPARTPTQPPNQWVMVALFFCSKATVALSWSFNWILFWDCESVKPCRHSLTPSKACQKKKNFTPVSKTKNLKWMIPNTH